MKTNRNLTKKTAAKVMSYLLAAAMIAGSISLSPLVAVETQAAVVTKNVNLNANNSIAGIENPTSGTGATAWTGTTVYYGDRAYLVLDKDGGIGGHSSKSGHMLLLSKGVLEQTGRKFDDTDPKVSDWTASGIRAALNDTDFLNKPGAFTDKEKEAIGTTAINNANTDDGGHAAYPSDVTNDKIFLLDLGDI